MGGTNKIGVCPISVYLARESRRPKKLKILCIRLFLGDLTLELLAAKTHVLVKVFQTGIFQIFYPNYPIRPVSV